VFGGPTADQDMRSRTAACWIAVLAASTFPINKAAATKPSPGPKLHVDARSETDMFVIEAGSSPVANSETHFANLRNEANQPKAISRPSPSIVDIFNTFEIEIQEYYSASKTKELSHSVSDALSDTNLQLPTTVYQVYAEQNREVTPNRYRRNTKQENAKKPKTQAYHHQQTGSGSGSGIGSGSGSGIGSGSGSGYTNPLTYSPTTIAPTLAPTGSGSGSGSGAGYTTSPTTIAPTPTPVTAAPATATGVRVRQAVRFASLNSTEYMANEVMRGAYEKGFGYALGILSIIAGNATYTTGCYVTSTAASARRSATITFDAFVPTSAEVTVSDGGVDAASLQLGVSTVVSEDSTYSSVSVPSYDSITVYAATVTLENSEDDSGSAIDLVFLLCILSGCLAAVLILGIALYVIFRKEKLKDVRTQQQAWAGIQTDDGGLNDNFLTYDSFGEEMPQRLRVQQYDNSTFAPV